MKRVALLVMVVGAACQSGGGSFHGPFVTDDGPTATEGGTSIPDGTTKPVDFGGTSPDFSNVETPPDFATPPDFKSPLDFTVVAKKPVGSTCTSAGQCSGTNAKCTTSFGNLNAPNGYCTNSPCTNDNDCGNGGFCATFGSKTCLGDCAAANECQKLNPNNRCFWWDNNNNACLPSAVSACNPTLFTSGCQTGKGCLRAGFDDVGLCYTTCSSINDTCANDINNNPQSCYFLNQKFAPNGSPTNDQYQGLLCILRGMVAIGQACTLSDDCVAGAECDYFASHICRQLCQSGQTTCASGTCQNAFKLTSFGFGAVGLCLP